MTFHPILLTKKKTGLARLVEKKTFFGRAARILTSPKTTVVLGVTLASLLSPATALAAARTVGKAALGIVKKRPITSLAVAGVRTTSPKARKFVVEAPGRIFGGGKKIGEIIEDTTRAADILGIKEGSTLKEKLITGAKVAGVAGLVVGGLLGAKALLKKKKETTAKRLLGLPGLPGLKQVGFTEARPVGIGGVPVPVTSGIQPIGRPGQPITKQPVSNIIQIQVH